MKTQVFEIVEIRVHKGVDVGFGNKYSLLPNMVLLGGGEETLPSFNVVVANCTWVVCQYKPMSLKWSRVR